MKILQVMAGGRHGGAETACVDMCIALKEAGQEIEAVIRPHPERIERLQQAGIKVHTLPFGGPLELYTSFALKKIIREFKPEIVQTWMSRAAQKVSRGKSYVTVARLGGYYKVSHFKSIDCFVTITPDIKRYLVDNGIDESLVRHINNFADVEEADAPASRTALDTPEDATLLLGLGRLHTAKAFDSLIKAVAGMEDVYLWIAGEGPERENLESLIKELNVASRVKLLGWRDDRAALLQACDICFFSSRYEPFGTVFVQAWAQKAALITTNADGPRQFVRDGQDGLVVKIDDIPAFRAAIQRLGDKNLSNSLIEKGYQRYRGEFTKERCVDQYLAFYQEAIARKTARDAA